MPSSINRCQVKFRPALRISERSLDNNNGLLVNGANFDVGLFNQSFRLDGINDFVAIPDSDLWAFGNDPFTISLFANFDFINTVSQSELGNTFIGHDQGGGNLNKWVFFYENGGNLKFHINSPGIEPVFFPAPTQFSPIVGQWHHFALTRNESTYTFYADGISLGSVNNSSFIPNANASLTIGQAEGLGFFNGRLDEIQIFDQALSETEISRLAQIETVSEPQTHIAAFALLVLGGLSQRLWKKMSK